MSKRIGKKRFRRQLRELEAIRRRLSAGQRREISAIRKHLRIHNWFHYAQIVAGIHNKAVQA